VQGDFLQQRSFNRSTFDLVDDMGPSLQSILSAAGFAAVLLVAAVTMTMLHEQLGVALWMRISANRAGCGSSLSQLVVQGSDSRGLSPVHFLKIGIGR